MFRRIDDFLDAWRAEAETTSKVMRALTDASLGQRIHPGGRTLGRLAWHVAETIPEMMGHAGVTVAGPGQRTDTPTHADEIAGAYERAARELPAALRAAWTDDQLDDEVQMYGQTWKKGVVLTALISHQAHHRGQMTVLMRQAGLKVPGCYGPAAEEWQAMGMQPLA